MNKLTKKEVSQTIADYRLWIAALEQYLIDNNITQAEIKRQLNQIKKQLNIVPTLKSILDIHKKISHIDSSLNTIQRQLILAPAY